MERVNEIPSRWLRAFASLTRWGLWLLAGAWIMLALVWGGLHFLIVPRIAELRPWLEQQASQRMGITVQVGDILATSNGLIPSVELRDVRLLTPDGRQALHLPSVLAALSVRSALGLGFEQLYIAAPELEVRRAADGRLWVAGFALPQDGGDGSAAADWVFSQTELVVRGGRVRWVDEQRQQPPLELADVDVLIRNRLRVHSLRLDADPPAGWGTRLSLRGRFTQSLFAIRPGDWRNWSGQAYAEATQIDLAQLRNYVDLGVDLRQGAGSLRAWTDVAQAQLQSATADVALQTVTVKLDAALEPLDLERIHGRLGLRWQNGGQTFFTEGLAFDTRDGLHWPGGNVQLSLQPAQAGKPAHGALQADRLDLAAIRDIASRLPLHAAVHRHFQQFAPQGLVEQLALNWEGELAKPQSYAARGRVRQLALAAQPVGESGIPGLKGANLDFELNQAGGRASLNLQQGSLEFPGIFAQPVLPFDTLAGDLLWKLEGDSLQIESKRLQFANSDGQGELRIKWQGGLGAPPAPSGPTAPGSKRGSTSTAARWPGVLDLSGSLQRAQVPAVPRYLPLALNQEARDYLGQALVGGVGSNVQFRVKGDLAHFPFVNPKLGEFHISGQFSNASYAYAPALVLPKDSPPWPVLTQASGTLVLDHDTLRVQSARGLVASGSALQFSKTDVTINKLYQSPEVLVSAEARGPLTEGLAFVNASPLGGWLGNALSRSQASGNAEVRLKLAIPVAHLEKSTVQGSVQLAGNDFQLAPGVPRLGRIRGLLAFNESGFSVNAVQARAIGGELRLDGAMNFGSSAQARSNPGSLHLSGMASAEGLRQASELGPVARLGQFASGSTAYTATLTLKAGVPELQLNSSLSGLALNLPAPFYKPAEGALPLHLESSLVRASQQPGARLQDQLQIELGKLASVQYVRDLSGAEARVLRGAIAVGLGANESAPLPDEGVVANISTDVLDVDAWSAVLARLAAPAGPNAAAQEAAAQSYLPNSLALRARELHFSGRTFNQLVLGAARDGTVWRSNVDAAELNGYVEYRQSSASSPGRVYARLAHLVLGQTAEQEVEKLLDQQPASIPALDVVVEDMELRGKKLGRVEIQAVNLGGAARDAVREWRLNRFNISTPEATLTATGNWALLNAQAAVPLPAGARERRRTALNFRLEVADSGDLLKRMGMPGVIAKGRGLVAGQVSWQGAPFSPDYPSMGGGFNVNMESGQFLKADPGIAKLLGVLSLQSLPRRLALDFRDVFSDGFAFDFVRGDVSIEQGMARTNNLQMKGVNAAVLMEGQADIARETQNLKVVVIPEINVASASLIYSAINPLVGLTTFLANLILRRPLIEANTQEFLIDGSWLDPRVTKVEHKSESPPAPPATSTPVPAGK